MEGIKNYRRSREKEEPAIEVIYFINFLQKTNFKQEEDIKTTKIIKFNPFNQLSLYHKNREIKE